MPIHIIFAFHIERNEKGNEYNNKSQEHPFFHIRYIGVWTLETQFYFIQ